MLIVTLWAVPRWTAGLCLSPCELILCYCCKLNNMIYGIDFVNICMSDILACVECCCAIALHLGGSNPSREIPLLGIAHPVEGIYFSGTEDALGDGMHPGP